MAAVCDVCAKGPGFGKSVSHSHRRTHRSAIVELTGDKARPYWVRYVE